MKFLLAWLLVLVIDAVISIIRNWHSCRRKHIRFNMFRGYINLYIRNEIGNGWWVSLLCARIVWLLYLPILLLYETLKWSWIESHMGLINIILYGFYFVSFLGTITVNKSRK